ncbi:DUF3128 domain-containing protein [Cinnamomum micranthum f. kanehirae]|uniref:DUF3128 domain-containing protein n=1 Tax=Cinnamomum micranthum f. kanehirae TaxID=337451 RepID=A0A3S3MZ92_9MAGN|nr:DUF3128 domain-containing protein [Cinnamomum micranthum f. kanehirae]
MIIMIDLTVDITPTGVILSSKFEQAPVHQMQQYYRHGVPDSCSEKWSALFDCFNLKTKRSSEVQEILEARERSKTHIWSFRSVDEASSHWKELFGHINDEE